MTREMISERGDLKGHFLICLLDEMERLRLDSKDEEYLTTYWDNECGEVDIPLEEWKKSGSNLKFASSVSWRATYVIEISESDINLQESSRSPLNISNFDRHPRTSWTNSDRSLQVSQYGKLIKISEYRKNN